MRNERSVRHRYVKEGITVGFLTDPTLCIGCKACEVACKEWNDVPASCSDPSVASRSYDHSGALGANTWRHVKFVEAETAEGLPRWLFLSDVCKHCSKAGCLDACPTGAIWRSEVGSVVVDDDRCNGCGYCVVSCPFGVIDRRGRPEQELLSAVAGSNRGSQSDGGGGAFKCTMCYDRQVEGKLPACANACPTDSILFGPLQDLTLHAQHRLETLHGRGVTDAVLYGADAEGVGGTHALSILLGAEQDCAGLWGQPATPVAPRAYLATAWTSALVSASLLAVLTWFVVSSL